jgi:hypothetical protein
MVGHGSWLFRRYAAPTVLAIGVASASQALSDCLVWLAGLFR